MITINFPNPFRIHSLLFLLLIITFSSTTASAVNSAPDTAPKSSTFELTKDNLQAKIESIKSRQGVDESLKSKLLSVYQSAQDNLGNRESFKAKEIDFRQAIKQAPENTKKVQKEIEQILARISKQKPEVFSGIATEELDQRLIIEKSKVSSLDEQIKKLENELTLQQARPQLIREETLAAQQDIEGAQKKLEAPPDKADSKLEIEARQAQLRTLIDSRTAELKMLEAEANSNPARVELLKAEVQSLDIQKNALSPVIIAIEALLSEHRQQEAREMQDALSQVEKELSTKHKLIQESTRENIQYSRDLQAITAKIEQYTDQQNKIDARANEIEADFKSAEKKISLAGLSPALGKILREQRRNLSMKDEFEQQSQAIQNETAITGLEQFKVEDKIKMLRDIDANLKELMSQQVDQALPLDQRMRIQAELRMLLTSQKELLNKLSVAYSTYLRTLGDFDFARQQMLSQANKFAAYLDERLLWVPSSEPVNSHYITDLYLSGKWLLSPHNWMAVTKDAAKLALENVFLAFVAILSLVTLFLCKNWAKVQLKDVWKKAEKIYTDSFYLTLRALAYTLILVLPLPLLVYFLGSILSNNIQVDNFSKAVGVGLRNASIPWLLLQFFYRIFADEGIARKHFQWQKNTTQLLRRQLAWLRFIVVPSVFIISCTSASDISLHSDSLGRLALIIIMVAMAVFLGRLLNPASGLLRDYINANPGQWLVKLRYVWYSASILIPLTVTGFAVTGYYLSALELQQQLIISLRLIFLMVIFHAMVLRWLTLVNRQLAIKNAIQKRKAALSEKQPAVAGGEEPVLPIDEQLIDIPTINAQTIRLLNVFIGFSLIIGFWMIWKKILPAFSFLENIVLWRHLVKIDNQDVSQPITLTNLMLAGLYVFISVVSVRNFSGVMELLVFRRLPIEAGGRYAVNQLAKYILVSIGFISVANELGVSWSEVHWLVAALSVGLGFGLQEIFANMVSGIILLFERPIRVGDVITIGDISGKVSRIQIRATTLIDGDRKDVVIPNKTFITSELVNWTLSDTIIRIVIPVGIAYGSDVELAHDVIIETVQSSPLVLTEPEPETWFIGYGDSSLNFSIFIFVELANGLLAKQDVLIRLKKALAEHNIEIPFPQRDIHIRSVAQDSKTESFYPEKSPGIYAGRK
ncbi:MAG: mechanosensitive ion channel [Methylococcales bacterium]|nr:mechanosensitive ion channel [Methylococcales bacterium]